MKIGISTGYRENYWGKDWLNAKQLGGSEAIALNLSRELARIGHRVTLRLPYRSDEFIRDGVRHIGDDAGSENADLIYAFDDFSRKDLGRAVLVACRSDPPPHTDFSELIFLSAHHAKLMGHPGRPHVGGGVHVSDYLGVDPRVPRRVICTSSPDRCPQAAAIGRAFDFVHTYKPVSGYSTVQVSREELVRIQGTARVLIYPYDPVRESDFFSMAVLESLCAGTPAVISDGESLVEMWGEAAVVLDRPIDLGEWYETVEELLTNKARWGKHSKMGRRLALKYDWSAVALRYLEAAGA